MGSWSRGGGRRLCRGEVGCRVELRNLCRIAVVVTGVLIILLIIINNFIR